jgi:hypothetical protein
MLLLQNDAVMSSPGHFAWEEAADEYATIVIDWWNGAEVAAPKRVWNTYEH